MQETANLHPSSILCQQRNHHPCKVVLKDVKKHSSDLSTTAKFKSRFDYINSSLNGNFVTPCDSHQILHNFTHVKEKLNKDLIFLTNKNTRNFMLPKSPPPQQLHYQQHLQQQHHQLQQQQQPNIPGCYNASQLHQKRNNVQNGCPVHMNDQNISSRGICNGFKNGVLNGISPATKSDEGPFESEETTRISNGCYAENGFDSVNVKSNRSVFTSPTSKQCNGILSASSTNCQDDVKPEKHILHSGNKNGLTSPVSPTSLQNGITLPASLKNDHESSPLQDKKQSECSFSYHRKHIKLKEIHQIDNSDIEPSDKPDLDYVLRSSQRLSFLKNWHSSNTPINTSITKKLVELANTCFDIKLCRKQSVVGCQSKKMRSSPDSSEYNVRNHSGSNNTTSGGCKCEWHDCDQRFETVEHLTKHIKADHILPARDNDVFVCLWRDCKFSNQPSCSFKWLSKHVTSHCDLKPFKCVIFGCDMTFVTQNGLARHVPTHFNESRVRRTCVLTSELAQRENLKVSKPQKRPSTPNPPNSTVDVDDKSDEDKNWKEKTRFERFLGQNISRRKASTRSGRKTSNTIKNKVQRATCNPTNNSGYIGKDFRIQHQIIGRCTTPNGSSQVLLAPTLHNIYPHQSFWFGANEFRKRKLTYVDVKVKDLTTDAKNHLYDKEHASRRRTKKRK